MHPFLALVIFCINLIFQGNLSRKVIAITHNLIVFNYSGDILFYPFPMLVNDHRQPL